MSRHTAFHVRGGEQTTTPQGRSGFFGKRKASEARASMPVHVDRKAVIRRQALRKLAADAAGGVERIAILTELGEQRLRRLVEGEDALEAPLAMHIEEMLGLPSGWMENGEGPVPETVMEKLSSAQPPAPDSVDESIYMAGKSGAQAATSEMASPTAKSELAPEDKASMSAHQKGLQATAEVFPNIRQFLTENTGMTASTVSGSITGSRGFAERNARLVESALGVPKGWLSRDLNPEERERDLRNSLGAILDQPPPRRGRQAAAKVSTQEKVVSEKRSAPAAPKAAEKSGASDVAPPQPASTAPVEREQSADAVKAMGNALIEMLQARLDTGRLTEQQIAKVMGALFL